MTSTEVIGQFNRYVIGNYTRYPVCLTRGEGSARALFYGSITYLPLLWIAMIANHA